MGRSESGATLGMASRAPACGEEPVTRRPLLIDRIGWLDQCLQPHEPFSGLLYAASEPDEAKAGFHEVIRSAAPETDSSWLPSPHEANERSFVGFPRLPAVDGTRLGRISAPL
jgi:hypothetical protein